ncbi:DUF4124 domain-containing protein [Luteimonas sp. SJ-92]|uniref:DUF4124 domain-containing protein n=1 Tax=Luteimonas salinisoli TaxID=2752307 RepID=A0A853JAR5_9GAMM|nr:DUF4124 domain-containing protein [Luteimonas salinisoli]NZA25824.1 DUF4124 domain-containing protein [Luteimonas salinisoli]
MRPWLPPLLSLLVLALPSAAPAQDDDVTIYRCVSSDGSLTIGNTPCDDDDATQQVRTMLRPQDAPPRPPSAPSTLSEPAPVQVIERHVSTVREPRPMYECITPEGDHYTSDDGEGNPRWVPLWTLGYPGGSYHRPPSGSPPPTARRGVTFVDNRTRMPPPANISIPPAHDRPRPSPDTRPGPGRPVPPRPGHGYDYGYGYGQGGGTWIRDECVRLPQREVCDRLTDRRQTIRRQVFNAQQTERLRLREEERMISARLAEDCGIR